MKKEIVVAADIDNLELIINTVSEQMKQADFSPKQVMQISMAVEEIFVNIAKYAYSPEKGDVSIVMADYESSMTIEFSDSGKPYNPLEKDDPDLTLSADERQIGGLGIYMTKSLADAVKYSYKDGKNILKIIKNK